MTLRQLFVRLRALPDDSWLKCAIRAAHAESEDREKVHQVEDALAMFGR